MNANNINKKMHGIMRSAIENTQGTMFEIDPKKKLNKYMMSAFSMRRIVNTSTEQGYRLFNKFEEGRVGKKVLTKTSKTKSWGITTASVMNIMLYGRKAYRIPKDPNSSNPLSWIAQKGSRIGKRIYWNWKTKGKLKVPRYRGRDTRKQIEIEIQNWLQSIQEKFLNLK